MSFSAGTTTLFGESDESKDKPKTIEDYAREKYGEFYEYGKLYGLNVQCSKNVGTELNKKYAVLITAIKGNTKFELLAYMPDYRVIKSNLFSGTDIVRIQQIVAKHSYEICAAGDFGYGSKQQTEEPLQCPQPPIEHGPYFPFMTISEEVEITVSGNYGTHDNPLYEVYIERPTDEGDFATLLVEMPFMETKFVKKMDSQEVLSYMRIIGCNRNNLLECGERGCGNA